MALVDVPWRRSCNIRTKGSSPSRSAIYAVTGMRSPPAYSRNAVAVRADKAACLCLSKPKPPANCSQSPPQTPALSGFDRCEDSLIIARPDQFAHILFVGFQAQPAGQLHEEGRPEPPDLCAEVSFGHRLF